MIENIRDLLPIGSVVLLAGGEKRLMIHGVKQVGSEDNSKLEYDYVSVPYPEGNIGNEYTYLFNHSDISEVVFRGYEDEERTDFIERLNEFYESSGEELI